MWNFQCDFRWIISCLDYWCASRCFFLPEPVYLSILHSVRRNYKGNHVPTYCSSPHSNRIRQITRTNLHHTAYLILLRSSSTRSLGIQCCLASQHFLRLHKEKEDLGRIQVKSSQVELYCHSATCGDIQWNEMSCLTGSRCYINTDIQQWSKTL